MALFFLTGDIAKVAIYTKRLDQLGVNRIHFRVKTSVGGGLDAKPIAAHFAALLAIGLKNFIGSDAIYGGVGVQNVTNKPYSLEAFDTTGTGGGTSGATALPSQVTAVTTLTTDFVGVRYRGRIYWPFPAKGWQSDTTGHPLPAMVTALDSLCTALIGTQNIAVGAAAVELEPVIVHRNDGSTTLVKGFRNKIKWGTQRRRGDFGAPNLAFF